MNVACIKQNEINFFFFFIGMFIHAIWDTREVLKMKKLLESIPKSSIERAICDWRVNAAVAAVASVSWWMRKKFI